MPILNITFGNTDTRNIYYHTIINSFDELEKYINEIKRLGIYEILEISIDPEPMEYNKKN